MLLPEHLKLLQETPLFFSVSPNEYEVLLQRFEYRLEHFKTGEEITREFDVIGILMSGRANILKESIDNSTSLVEEIELGGVFGEVLTCLDSTDSPYRVVAETDATVILIPYANFMTPSELKEHFTMLYNLMRLLARRNMLAQRKIEVLSKRTLADKILAFLAIQREITGCNTFIIPYTRIQLSEYLCADRSALSRELSNLMKAGLIKYKKNLFTVMTSYDEADIIDEDFDGDEEEEIFGCTDTILDQNSNETDDDNYDDVDIEDEEEEDKPQKEFSLEEFVSSSKYFIEVKKEVPKEEIQKEQPKEEVQKEQPKEETQTQHIETEVDDFFAQEFAKFDEYEVDNTDASDVIDEIIQEDKFINNINFFGGKSNTTEDENDKSEDEEEIPEEEITDTITEEKSEENNDNTILEAVDEDVDNEQQHDNINYEVEENTQYSNIEQQNDDINYEVEENTQYNNIEQQNDDINYEVEENAQYSNIEQQHDDINYEVEENTQYNNIEQQHDDINYEVEENTQYSNIEQQHDDINYEVEENAQYSNIEQQHVDINYEAEENTQYNDNSHANVGNENAQFSDILQGLDYDNNTDSIPYSMKELINKSNKSQDQVPEENHNNAYSNDITEGNHDLQGDENYRTAYSNDITEGNHDLQGDENYNNAYNNDITEGNHDLQGDENYNNAYNNDITEGNHDLQGDENYNNAYSNDITEGNHDLQGDENYNNAYSNDITEGNHDLQGDENYRTAYSNDITEGNHDLQGDENYHNAYNNDITEGNHDLQGDENYNNAYSNDITEGNHDLQGNDDYHNAYNNDITEGNHDLLIDDDYDNYHNSYNNKFTQENHDRLSNEVSNNSYDRENAGDIKGIDYDYGDDFDLSEEASALDKVQLEEQAQVFAKIVQKSKKIASQSSENDLYPHLIQNVNQPRLTSGSPDEQKHAPIYTSFEAQKNNNTTSKFNPIYENNGNQLDEVDTIVTPTQDKSFIEVMEKAHEVDDSQLIDMPKEEHEEVGKKQKKQAKSKGFSLFNIFKRE